MNRSIKEEEKELDLFAAKLRAGNEDPEEVLAIELNKNKQEEQAMVDLDFTPDARCPKCRKSKGHVLLCVMHPHCK